MKLRKLGLFAILGLGLFSLAACGSTSNDGDPTNPSGQTSGEGEGQGGGSQGGNTPSGGEGQGGGQQGGGQLAPEPVVLGKINVSTYAGDLESCYLEWDKLQGVKDYNVYYKESNGTQYTKIDSQLVREYGDHYRADVIGLKAGTYDTKVIPVVDNQEKTDYETVVSNLTVKSYDRTGFAFSTASTMSGNTIGAYNADGTLRAGAKVIYVTGDNAKTVKATIVGNEVTGLQGIIYAKQKASTSSEIVDIRIVGTIYANQMDAFGSSSEGLQIKGAKSYQNMNMTIEGIGNDAGIHGFGILMRNTANVELRNFGIMDFMDDGVSIDTDNSNLWVHNLDIFYGQAGGDADQAKGDGTIDLKGDSKFITISYNHFWDSGKASLCGMKSESGPNYISYHHNWFDHSDSRHPRIRTMSVHVYNNYYDGNSKYGCGAAYKSNAFVEGNYFRDCKYPMLSSMQGSDVFAGTDVKNAGEYGTFSSEDSGIIKSYNNKMEGNYTFIPYGCSTYVCKGTEKTYSLGGTTSTVDFDAYVVTSRNQTIPDTVKGAQGGSKYNNFDTSIDLGVTAEQIQTPEAAKETTMQYAGRVQGGDLKWTFDNSTEDTNYNVIKALKTAVVNYKSTLVRVCGIDSSSSGSVTPTPTPVPTGVTVADVIALIDALPEASSVTESNRTQIMAAYDAFDSLTSDEKEEVTNKDKLTACIAALPMPSSVTISFTSSTAKTGENNVVVYDANNVTITCTKIASIDSSRGLKFNSSQGFTIANNTSNNLQFVLTVVANDSTGKSFTYGTTTKDLSKTPDTITVTINAGSTFTVTTSTGGAFLTSVTINS